MAFVEIVEEAASEIHLFDERVPLEPSDEVVNASDGDIQWLFQPQLGHVRVFWCGQLFFLAVNKMESLKVLLFRCGRKECMQWLAGKFMVSQPIQKCEAPQLTDTA
jgi:hypothetical protein